MSRKLRIRQIASAIHRTKDQKKVIEALGIKRLHQVVVHDDTPQVRGMVNKVPHLLEVEEVSE